ncbi:MAG: TolC family protein [Candidatus Polarisedimenticolaceae bacterium]|nr:TolC family protein [Candidatus Polarisedimenticolaceae bacterium]
MENQSRKKYRAHLVVLLFAAVLFFPALQAAPSFNEAVQAALQIHPKARIHVALRQVGEGYQQQADALFGDDPVAGLAYRSDDAGSNRGYREWEANLDMPLWLPGQRGVRRNLGGSIISRAGAEFRLLSWEVAGQVLERAWTLRLAESNQEQTKNQWDSAKALEIDIERRVNAGELARSDLILAQQEALAKETSYQHAMATVERERSSWRAYTTFDELPHDLMARQSPGTELNPSHPRLVAAELAIEQARAQRNDVKLKRRDNPVLTLYAKRDRGIGRDPYGNSLGVGISVPFGTHASAAPVIAGAELALTEAQADWAQVTWALELELEQAHQGTVRAAKNLTLAEQGSRLAQTRIRLARRAFELGEADLYFLLLAREQAATAARQLEFYRLERMHAIAQLNHIRGEGL